MWSSEGAYVQLVPLKIHWLGMQPSGGLFCRRCCIFWQSSRRYHVWDGRGNSSANYFSFPVQTACAEFTLKSQRLREALLVPLVLAHQH